VGNKPIMLRYDRGVGGNNDGRLQFSASTKFKGIKQLKIFKALMTSAILLSAVFLLAGCGHGLINRLI
jgi:hypothetical protein